MGEVVSTTLTQPQRVLYLNIDGYTSGIRHNRNVISARLGITPSANFVVEKTFRLSEDGTAGSEYTFVGETNNHMTLVYSEKPVNIVVTNANGSIDMGPQTLFITTASIVSLGIVNDGAEPTDVAIIHA